MSMVMITGSAGLIGSEAALYFAALGFEIVGIDNDMRRVFFGEEASTQWQRRMLEQKLGAKYRHVDADIRDFETIKKLFKDYARDLRLVIHAAAQPSHDWAASDPQSLLARIRRGTRSCRWKTKRPRGARSQRASESSKSGLAGQFSTSPIRTAPMTTRRKRSSRRRVSKRR